MKKNNIINEWLLINNDPIIEKLVKRQLAFLHNQYNTPKEINLAEGK